MSIHSHDATSGYLEHLEQSMRERSLYVRHLTLAARDPQFSMSVEAAAQIMVSAEVRELTRALEALIALMETK